MSPLDRVLGVSARLAVCLWLAFALAVSVDRDPLEPELAELAPELAARVRPLVEPAAAPAEALPRSETLAVGAPEIEKGLQLLDGSGHFPVLSCSYEDFGSFRSYALAMVGLGARFVVVRQREIVGELSLETGSLTETSPGTDFSPRARDYSGEPDLAPLTTSARKRFGTGSEVMMLVPRDLDAGLFGGIARALGRSGHGHEAFRELRGRYERGAGGDVHLRVSSGVQRDGSEVPLDLLFDLGQISGSAARRGHEA